MHKNIKILFCALITATYFTAAGQARAYSPIGYPGASWGEVCHNFNGMEGACTQGWVRQGADLYRFSGGQVFQAYTAYNWRLRTKHETYYNVHGPALGMILGWGAVDTGIEMNWPHYTELRSNDRDAAVFSKWYKSWELAEFIYGGKKGLPFSTWGEVAYDLYHVEGSITQGWVKQGVDWVTFPCGAVMGTYASYKWRFRSRNEKYYDAHGPSLGFSLNVKSFDIGAEYAWQYFPRLKTSSNGLLAFVRWYVNWDLKNK